MERLPAIDNSRIIWVDNLRGFVMFGTVLGWLLPREVRNFAPWYFNHPIDTKNVDTMNLPDVGIVAYLIIMGMMIRLSYNKRKAINTYFKTQSVFFRRFALILLIGSFFHGFGPIYVEGRPFLINNLVIFYWGPLHTLGVCGLLAGLFAPVSQKFAIILFAAFFLVYYFLNAQFDLSIYIAESKFGGPIGSIFGFFPVLLLSFAIADLLLLNRHDNELILLFRSMLLALLLFSAGFSLQQFSSLTINMRLVSIPYLLISTGIVISGIVLFRSWSVLSKNQLPIISALGRNSLIVFICLLLYSRYKSSFLSMSPLPEFAAMLFLVILTTYLNKRNFEFKL